MSEAISNVPDTPEIETLEQLGAELRERREEAGYSLSEIADAIRINQEVLTAIEGGQVDYGPGQTFIRGFMRSYARFLDMDPQALQERLNIIMGVENKTAPHPILPVQEIIKGDQRSKGRWVWAAAAVVIIGAAVAWYLFAFQMSAETTETAAAVVEPEPAPEVTPEPQAPDAQVTERAEAPQSTEPADEQAAVVPEAATEPTVEEAVAAPESVSEEAVVAESAAETVTEVVPAPEPEGQAAEGEPAVEAEASAPAEADAEVTEATAAEEAAVASIAGTQAATPGLQLTVDAHEQVWISLEIDGKTGVDVLLEEGDTYEWEADERYVLTVGNVHSVKVKLNGQPLTLDTSKDLLLNRVLDASLLN